MMSPGIRLWLSPHPHPTAATTRTKREQHMYQVGGHQASTHQPGAVGLEPLLAWVKGIKQLVPLPLPHMESIGRGTDPSQAVHAPATQLHAFEGPHLRYHKSHKHDAYCIALRSKQSNALVVLTSHLSEPKPYGSALCVWACAPANPDKRAHTHAPMPPHTHIPLTSPPPLHQPANQPAARQIASQPARHVNRETFSKTSVKIPLSSMMDTRARTHACTHTHTRSGTDTHTPSPQRQSSPKKFH